MARCARRASACRPSRGWGSPRTRSAGRSRAARRAHRPADPFRARGAVSCGGSRRGVGCPTLVTGVGTFGPHGHRFAFPERPHVEGAPGLVYSPPPGRTRGGMAEWFKATVLKTVERKLRGFESYSLRQSWSGGRVAEGSRLLSG